jgi:hypothetical protein
MPPSPDSTARDVATGREKRQGERADAEGASASQAPRPAAPSAAPKEADAAEDYAATGIGRQTEHRVEQVFFDLEPNPVATIDLRYEYRAQLVRLGVIAPPVDRLTRREGARGFEPGFCPDPKR